MLTMTRLSLSQDLGTDWEVQGTLCNTAGCGSTHVLLFLKQVRIFWGESYSGKMEVWEGSLASSN